MKIHELRLSTDLKKADHDEMGGIGLKKVLSAHGWKLLGYGEYGAAAEHPNKSYVLKIFEANNEYAKFVEFAQEHQDNPHFPKFSRGVRIVPGTKFSYVRMERLHPIDLPTIRDKYILEICLLWKYAKQKDITPFPYGIRIEIENKTTSLGFTLDELSNDSDNKIEDMLMDKFSKAGIDTWISALHDLLNESKRIGINFLDLHDANFMLRSETLVILDPF